MDVVLVHPDHPAYEALVISPPAGWRVHAVGARFRQSPPAPPRPLWYRVAADRIRERARKSPRVVQWHFRRFSRRREAWGPLPDRALLQVCGRPLVGEQPWIGDYENVNVLGMYEPSTLRSPRFQSFLTDVFAAHSCRGIRVWSEAGRRSFLSLLPDPRIAFKLRVISPVVEVPASLQPHLRAGRSPRIVFAGRGFDVKGGRLFLEAIRKLRGQLDFSVDFVCDLPAAHDRYRHELSGVVRFIEPTMPRERFQRDHLQGADVCVMLGMADSFGMAVQEALAVGVPVIAFRLHSGLSELVRHGETGLLLEPRYQIFGPDGVHAMSTRDLLVKLRADPQAGVVDEIAEAIGGLLADHQRRLAMAVSAADDMASRFSVARMQAAFGEMYSSSIA